MTIIKSKDELYKLLPVEFQRAKSKKLIGKIFSIGAENYWTVEYENEVLYFTYDNDLIKCTGSVWIKNIPNPIKINLNKVLFKQSGFETSIPVFGHRLRYYFLTSDNKILTHVLKDANSLICFARAEKRSDIISVSYTESSLKEFVIKNNPDCFKKLEWKDFGSYSGILCVKDCGMFKRGTVIDTAKIGYNYQNRSPMDLVNYGHYAGLYRIGFSTACDLSKVTLEQLENISVTVFSCSKQKFGCSHGCTHNCYSESANNCDKEMKRRLIKLWKEIFKTEKN